MMVGRLLMMTLALIIGADAYADLRPMACFHAALADKSVVETDQDLPRKVQLFILCEHAKDLRPLRCYHTASKDSEVFPFADKWHRSILIARLCSNARNDAPVKCLKSASKDKFFAFMPNQSSWTSGYFAGLCSGASSAEPVECVKKALTDPIFPSLKGWGMGDDYVIAAGLCGMKADHYEYSEKW